MALQSADGKPPPQGIQSIVKGYLVAYNIVLSCGWFTILLRTLQYMTDHTPSVSKGAPGLYDVVQAELRAFQTVAILEVAHCMLGVVRTNLFTTLLQVYSRLFIVWGVVEAVPQVCECFGLCLVLLAWSITEVIRYTYYAFSLLGSVPYIIQWLRYSLFYVLYPTGVLGEMMLVFTALPTVRASNQWSLSMPNPCNMAFSYYYFLIFVSLSYIPGFPQLYGHMINQRKKVLGAKSKQD